MLKPDPETLGALGLAGASLEDLDASSAPPTGLGLGFATTEAEPLGAIVDGLRQMPAHTALDLGRSKARFPDLVIARWDLQPGIVLIDAAEGEVDARAGLEVEPGLWAVDARFQTVWALVRGAGGELLLGASPRELHTWSVKRRPLLPLDELGPRGPVDLAPPALEALLEGAPASPWLVELYRRLAAAGTQLAAVVAAGVVARLHSPPADLPRAERMRLLELRAAGQSPAAVAARWFETLSQATRGDLVESALARVSELHGAIEWLVREVAHDPEKAREAALRFAHARDDLEGVAVLLGRYPEVPPLLTALCALDREVARHHTIWSALRAFEDDPRLSTVSWVEPDAWWGLLAHGS